MADQKDRHKRDLAPITGEEDRKIYFAVRKLFSGEDVDEKTFDTTSYSSPDVFAYLVTWGYKTHDDRYNYSLGRAKEILRLRKKYGLGPNLEPEYWNPKWTFSIPEEVFKKEWPTCALGRDKDGDMVVFDTMGAVSTDFVNLLNKSTDGWDAATLYSCKTLENFARVKMMMSNKQKERITSYVAIIDASNVGLTTFNPIRNFFTKTSGDMQVMYTEVTKKMYVVNSGWLFRAAWMLIKQIIDPILATKITVCGYNWKNDIKEAGITLIPSFMGGKCNDYILGGDTMFPPREAFLCDDNKADGLPQIRLQEVPKNNESISKVGTEEVKFSLE